MRGEPAWAAYQRAPRTGMRRKSACAANQRDQILGRRQRAGFAFVQNALGKRAFLVVQLDDALLDATLADQAIDGHRSQLPDAMRPTHGLVFGGRVPPWVGNDHVIGSGQVEPEATGFQADQEEICLLYTSLLHELPGVEKTVR